jgi:hypothetical protein
MSISLSSSESPKSVSSTVKYLIQPRGHYWLARLICSGSIFITATIAYLSPESMQKSVLDDVGTTGWELVLLVFGLSAFCFIETIVNDLLPERFCMEWADVHRHYLYMGLSLLLAWLIWLNLRHDANGLLILRYGFDCTCCFAIAAFDTVARFRKVQQQARGETN